MQTASLYCSNAKSTLIVPLTIVKLEKTKPENFDFVHLSSSSSSITQKLYVVSEYYVYQTTALPMKIIPTCSELCVS